MQRHINYCEVALGPESPTIVSKVTFRFLSIRVQNYFNGLTTQHWTGATGTGVICWIALFPGVGLLSCSYCCCVLYNFRGTTLLKPDYYKWIVSNLCSACSLYSIPLQPKPGKKIINSHTLLRYLSCIICYYCKTTLLPNLGWRIFILPFQWPYINNNAMAFIAINKHHLNLCNFLPKSTRIFYKFQLVKKKLYCYQYTKLFACSTTVRCESK
jgi:hypothetical protein